MIIKFEYRKFIVLLGNVRVKSYNMVTDQKYEEDKA